MWVKQVDVHGARYVAVKGVDVQQSVDDFTARWVADEKLDVRPSLVTLRLVRCGPHKPTVEEEEAAVVLDDPSLSLAESGVTNGCSLLAFVAGSPGANSLCWRLVSYARVLTSKAPQYCVRQTPLHLSLVCRLVSGTPLR